METEDIPRPASARLVRRKADKKIAGVAAGVADHFSIDPVWTRLTFILTAFTGIGIVAYIALWILVPASEEPAAEPSQTLFDAIQRLGSTTVGTIAIILGILVVGTQIFDDNRSLFWGLALVGIGVYLFRDRAELASSPPPAHETTPVAAPRLAGSGAVSGGVSGEGAPALAPAPRRRERSPLGLITVGVTLVILGLIWLVNMTSAIEVRLVQYLAVTVVLLSAGLLVGSFYGRARWLGLPLVILIPATIVASAITLPFEGGVGDIYSAPERWQDVSNEFRLAAGEITIDLHRLPPPPDDIPRRLDVAVTIGSIQVYVPSGMAFEVRGRASMGTVELGGEDHGGFDIDEIRRFGPPDAPVVALVDLQTSLGSIEFIPLDEDGIPVYETAFYRPSRREARR